MVLWLSGISRAGDWRLVIHRPYYDPSYFAQLSADHTDQRYHELEDELYSFLHDMNTPETVIARMRDIPSTEGEILSSDYVDRALSVQVPSYDEWLTAKCGRTVPNDNPYHLAVLDRWISKVPLTAEEQAFLDQEHEIMRCRGKAQIDARNEAWSNEFE